MAINGFLLNTIGVVGVWDGLKYSCSQFKNEIDKSYFVIVFRV